MFADALEKMRQFTRPIFASMRFYDGTTEAGLGACVFINKTGWFVTACHLLDGDDGGQGARASNPAIRIRSRVNQDES
jgi:hypothetical protein